MYIISNKDVSIIILIMRVTCTAATKASLIDKKIDDCHHLLAIKAKGWWSWITKVCEIKKADRNTKK